MPDAGPPMSLWPLFTLISFACGAIPCGLLIARAKGVDIRAHGSGNIGATNVWRVMGWRYGLPCFVLDVVKGFAPVLVAGLYAGIVPASLAPRGIASEDAWWWLAVLAAAILGHMFTPLAGFKGGKGVATGLGAALGMWPVLTLPAIVALLVWILVAKLTRMVSAASCLAAAVLPAMVWVLPRILGRGADADGAPVSVGPFVIVTALLGLLVIVRHRANLARILAGTENRIGARAAKPSGEPRA